MSFGLNLRGASKSPSDPKTGLAALSVAAQAPILVGADGFRLITFGLRDVASAIPCGAEAFFPLRLDFSAARQ
jgi:hypothetical protein